MCIQQGFCVQGWQDGRPSGATLYTDIPARRGDRQPGLDRVPWHEDRALGPTGVSNSVVYRDGQGREQQQKARIVCIAGQRHRDAAPPAAFRTPRNSRRASLIPMGQVGRNYCQQIIGFVWGIFDKPSIPGRGATLAESSRMKQKTTQPRLRGLPDGLSPSHLPTLPWWACRMDGAGIWRFLGELSE